MVEYVTYDGRYYVYRYTHKPRVLYLSKKKLSKNEMENIRTLPDVKTEKLSPNETIFLD